MAKLSPKNKELYQEELYRRYKRDYKLRERRLSRKYGSDFEMDDPMMSKADFFREFNSYKNDITEYERNTNINAKEPSSQRVIDVIVSDQAFDISIREARAFKEALDYSTDDWESRFPKGQRPNLTTQNIRRGLFGERIYDEKGKVKETTGALGDMFKAIREYRERRFEEGASKEKVRDEVRSTFFGSK